MRNPRKTYHICVFFPPDKEIVVFGLSLCSTTFNFLDFIFEDGALAPSLPAVFQHNKKSSKFQVSKNSKAVETARKQPASLSKTTMAMLDIDRPTLEERDAHYKPGSIRRVKLNNFLTYDAVEFFPGAR